MNNFRWLAALMLFAAPVFAAPPLQQYLEEFDQQFHARMAKSKIPGGIYVVVKGDQIVKIGTHGVREVGSKAKVDENTIFRLASVSKTFAAGLATQLEHEGKFNWNDAATRYVPDFSFRSPNLTKQVKVEHMLGQNSGLSANAFDDLIENNMTPEQILPRFGQINPRCAPGKCYGYQNVFFSLIARVMQKTTGSSYEQLLEQRIFRPLQMHTASVGYSGFLANKNRAMPHVGSKKGWVEAKVVPTYYRVNPAAGVNASARDMGQWLIARLGHRPQVLSVPVINDMHTPRVQTADNLMGRTFGPYVSDAYYGLGLRIYRFGKHTLYHHGGLVKGYRTDLSYSLDKDMGIVVLVNAQSNIVAELASEFWATMLDVSPQGSAQSAVKPTAFKQSSTASSLAVAGGAAAATAVVASKKTAQSSTKTSKKPVLKKKTSQKKAVKTAPKRSAKASNKKRSTTLKGQKTKKPPVKKKTPAKKPPAKKTPPSVF